MKKDIKKLFILNLPFLFVWYFGDKISWLFRMVEAENAGMKIYGCTMYFSSAFTQFPSHRSAVGCGIGSTAKTGTSYEKQKCKKF